MADTALSIRSLSKTFSGTTVLSDVDLDIQPGEIRALVGQNGCGKSTLIKVLAGYHDPDHGAEVTIDGSPLHLGVVGAADAAGLRFVHQDLGLVTTLDAVDNLALGPGYDTGRGGLIAWRKQRRIARKALTDLGYNIDVRRPMAELTVAERTAVAVARALSHRSAPARVLVLDEPTANLPGAEAERLFALVRRVRDSGVAVLFVSHHLAEVFDLCDSVTVLRDGKLVTTRPTEGLTEDELVTLMIGRSLEEYDVHAAVTAHQGEVSLSVEDLHGSVLKGLNFQIRSGEVLGIAGITGSGREEIALSLFGGVPRTGTVTVNGKVLEPQRPDLAIDAEVGLVPAERHLNAAFLDFSLRENVSIVEPGIFSRMGLLSSRLEKSDVQGWLEKLRVHPKGTEIPLANLSGGNQQKVVLARWLRRNPRLLILDEPTQGVDVGAKADIHALVDVAAASGAAVLVASTDNTELERLCDRVLVLYGGVVVDEMHRPHLNSDRLTAATLDASKVAHA